MRKAVAAALLSIVVPALEAAGPGTPAPAPRPATAQTSARDLQGAYAVERSFGARCPGDVPGRTRWDGPKVKNGCYGHMPSAFAALLRNLPASFALPAALGEEYTENDYVLKAIPGRGERADFMVDMFGSWIRSFEGSDPATTLYLVHFQYDPAERQRYRESHAVKHPDGVIPYGALRAFRLVAGGSPEDVTDQILPPPPTLTPEEAKRYGPHIASSIARADASQIYLDTDRLQYAPTMRWFMEFDPQTPISTSDPRRYSAWALAHFGFITWNGEHFELRRQVPRSLWPCRPVAQGSPACSYYPDAGADSFVTR